MKNRTVPISLVLLLAMLISTSALASAQVATLRTPGPDAEASEVPSEELDGQEAILQFAGCMRDEGIDFPDPQFGLGGAFGGPPAGSDFLSSDFLDAMEACQSLLQSLQPDVDPEQQAEENEQLIAFAECMRGEGLDFPDPDPVRGYTIAQFRSEDGGLLIDPFSADFQRASTTCAAVVGVDLPATAGQPE